MIFMNSMIFHQTDFFFPFSIWSTKDLTTLLCVHAHAHERETDRQRQRQRKTDRETETERQKEKIEVVQIKISNNLEIKFN